MTNYLGVYKKFISTSAAVETSFRTSFILLVLMDTFFFFTSLSSLNIIFNHVDIIGHWNRDQFSFFLCFMLMLDNLHMMMFSQSFWELSFNIRTGALDYVILRPLNIIFNVFFRHFRVSSLFNTPLYLGFLIYFGIRCELDLISWVLLPLFLILSLILYISLEFMMSALMFWTTDGNGINFLRMQMQQMARWPAQIYQGLLRKVFTTFIPVLLIGSAPLNFILGTNKTTALSYFILALGISLTLTHYTWKFALRFYESASS